MIKEQAFEKTAVEKMTYAQALTIAKQTNKQIMLKLTADNCKYCIKMDNEVLADTEVKELVDANFITVNINVDKETVPVNFKQDVTPTFVFVDKNEKIISKLPGSWNKKDFVDLLRNRI
jgi:thioredoxin-related protein